MEKLTEAENGERMITCKRCYFFKACRKKKDRRCNKFLTKGCYCISKKCGNLDREKYKCKIGYCTGCANWRAKCAGYKRTVEHART